MRNEFSKKTKVEGYERSGGKCELCGARLYPGKFRYDHRTPCAFGGDNSLSNLQVICDACDGAKTYGQDIPAIAKSNRVRARHIGAETKSSRPMPGGRHSPFKIKMDGSVVPRRPKSHPNEQR